MYVFLYVYRCWVRNFGRRRPPRGLPEELALDVAGEAALIPPHCLQALGLKLRRAALRGRPGVGEAAVALLREAEAGGVDLAAPARINCTTSMHKTCACLHERTHT